MSRLVLRVLVLCVLVVLSSCEGQFHSGGSDAGPVPDTTPQPDSGKADSLDTPVCGDGLITAGETCEGSCPTTCADASACTADVMSGDPATCDASCEHADITTCVSDDGCCAIGCDAQTDSDCSATCGDGVVDAMETCDGNCPSACDDGNACTVGRLTGSPEQCNVECSTTAITACVDGDGCCAPGCLAATDSDCAAVCGNGVVEGSEICDGDCPAACDDGMACTTDELRGSADRCDAVCRNTAITACTSGDGCCPATCNELNDDDCAAVCGNDVVETGETCDGACPDCDDGVACTADSMSGNPAMCNVACLNAPITACVDGDGCCPASCDSTDDDDCNAVCGNGVREGGEVCDPIADCPTACDDMNACTRNTLVGSAQTCDAVCLYPAITACADGDGCCPNGCNANNDDDCAAVCGNAIAEPGETCDPASSCPASVADCNDMNACTGDVYSGSAASCTAACTHNPVTACIGGDGCCPSTCTSATDTDCVAVCGNGVVEMGETCDPKPSCPTSCDDSNACTTDTLTGSRASCTSACQNTPVTMCIDGDGCCPAACDVTTDDDCSAMCGNGIVEAGETCDPVASCPTSCNDSNACTTDALIGSAANCTAACQNTAVTMCVDGDGCCPPACTSANDDDCTAMCGNGVVEAGETCDPVASCPTSCNDSNACTTDTLTGSAAACTAACQYAAITMCVDGDGCCPAACNSTNDDDCSAICGNGIVEAGETCDPVASCPTACNDSNACTTDTLNGAAATCNAACAYAPVTACVNGDNCCPAGCTSANDNDCSAVIDCTNPASWPSGWSSLEIAIFNETNSRRTSPQTCNSTSYPAAPALVSDTRLREAARCHAYDMSSNNFFSHTGTGGTSVGARATAAGYVWNAIAENIAAGNSAAVAIVNQWMNSTSGHCEAIMNPTYEDIGIGYGYEVSSAYDHYSVQVFGRQP